MLRLVLKVLDLMFPEKKQPFLIGFHSALNLREKGNGPLRRGVRVPPRGFKSISIKDDLYHRLEKIAKKLIPKRTVGQLAREVLSHVSMARYVAPKERDATKHVARRRLTVLEGTFHWKVHCHVCPLKDLCKYGDPDTSYRFHKKAYDLDYESEQKQRDDDFSAMQQITMNCPLRKLV